MSDGDDRDTRWKAKPPRKPKPDKVHKPRFRSHNAQSQSYSRPNAQISRVSNFIQVNDMLRHNAVDMVLTDTMYRKTAAPRFVELESLAVVHPNHKAYSNVKKTSGSREPKRSELAKAAFLGQTSQAFELSDLCRQLVLGNLSFALQSDAELREVGITGLLCVHDDPSCPSLSSQLPTIHLPMSDERLVSYTVFSQWIYSCLEAIERLSGHSEGLVLVYCGKGVNRSVAAVVGVLMLHSQISYGEALSCVDAAKQSTLALLARMLAAVKASPPPSPSSSSSSSSSAASSASSVSAPSASNVVSPTAPLSPSFSLPSLSPVPSSLDPPPPSFSVLPILYWDTLTNKTFRDYLKLLSSDRGKREIRDFESTAEEDDDGPCRLEVMSESDLEDSSSPAGDPEDDGFVLLANRT